MANEDRLSAMLGARSIAVVGASDRPRSFGERLATEALRSPSAPKVHLVNRRLPQVLGHDCVASLADVPARVDLVLLGVPDSVVVDQLATAARRGDAGAVVFGSAHELGPQLRSAAGAMALCGAGCMGFVNTATGVRAIGYLERHPLPTGSIALVTHSGSAFSALLRTHRRLEFSLVVSSGQELVTTAADYLAYALRLEQTRVVGLLLETLRDAPRLRSALREAADRDIPVVALTVGGSPTGRAMVSAHSGALAGDDAAWEALFAAYGVHRAYDLDELADSLEAFAIGRRVRRSPGGRPGLATVHDSGAERALVADVADDVDVPFAQISASTRDRLTSLLDEGLVGENPLDVWGSGADTAELLTESMTALADDESVGVVALAVDLVPEYDADTSYPDAVEATLQRTDKPVLVLSNSAAAVDQEKAGRLRALGVPVLEGTRTGLRTVRHLLDHARRPGGSDEVPPVDDTRSRSWRSRLAAAAAAGGPLDPVSSFALLEDYGLRVAMPQPVSSAADAVRTADRLGYPVTVKTGEPGVEHKTEAGGVVVGLSDGSSVALAYADLAGRLGERVLVQPQVAAGIELAVGIVRDPLLGPLVLLAAGGTLIELLSSRRVALPPVDPTVAGEMLDALEVSRLLAGVRGALPADRAAVLDAVAAVSQIAVELGDVLAAVDLNPLIVTATGAVVVDTLVLPEGAAGGAPFP
jgi:acetate---CoA ligase (ADP-forming)